ncbi:CAP-Gly domain-containing linker protein 1, partial [Zancudomyces culisetae]
MEARPGSRTNNPIASGIGAKGAAKPNSPMPRFSTSIQQRAGANSPVPQTPPNNQASGQIAQSVEGKSKVEVGKLVLAQDKKGVVRFMGETSFSTGLWIGVELEEQLGKNDGSVQGVRYFDAKPGYGLFVRISQVKVMQEETNTTPTMESRKLPSKRASLNMKSPLSSLPMGFTGSSNRMGSTSRLSVSGRSSEYDSRPSTPQSLIHSSSTSLNRSRSATPNISSISD